MEAASKPRHLIRLRVACDRLGFRSPHTVRDRVRRGLLPTPVKLSDGPTSPGLFPEYEIEAIIAARVAGATEDDIRALVAQLEAQRKAAA
jgi:prophage regulatory protein